MDRVFLAVLNMSLTASFVIAVVLLARIFLRRAPKIISYALWAVVLFNLLCPFKPESAFSLIPFRAEPISEQSAIVPGQELSIFEAALYSMQMPGNDVYIPVNPNSSNPDLLPDPSGEKVMAYLFGYQAYLILGSYIWPVGTAILFIYAIFSYIRLKRRISLAVRVEGNIYETDKIDSPFVLGLLRPRIFIPTGMEAALTVYIIEHERTHIKRRDYLVSVIAFAALALHWFNPLVWIAYMLMLRDMESSCDEAVLRKSSDDIRCEYSSALLNFSNNTKQLSFPLAFGEQGVKERVKRVLNFKKPSRIIIVAAIALVAVLSIGFAVNRTNKNPHELLYSDNILSITMNRYTEYVPAGDVVITDKIEIEQIVSVLSDASKTLRRSVNDTPVSQRDFIYVWLLYSDNRGQRFFLYTDGDNYIEEPYVGIYRTRKNFDELYSIYDINIQVVLNGIISLNELRELAAKGDALHYSDLPFLRPSLLSSVIGGYNPTLYGVEGGYRLLINFNDTLNPENGIRSTAFESIWETGGSGIDIRYSDVDEFIRANPSHPAVTVGEAQAIAQNHLGRAVTYLDVDWWERDDEFPHHSKDPAKQSLWDSLENIVETTFSFTDGDGTFIAIGRKYGTIYEYNGEIWREAS